MKVYLHADDFGLTRKITDDILACIDAGTINSVSVMVNGYAFEYAMDELSKRGNISISLHVNFDQGKCVSDASCIPLLVTKDGYIRSNFETLFFSYYLGSCSHKLQLKAQVVTEIRNQVEKFLPYLQKKKLPLQLDSERCSHMIPFIFDALIDMANEYPIRFIRIAEGPTYFVIRNMADVLSYTGTNMIKHILMKVFTRFGRYRSKLAKKNISTPDVAFSFLHGSGIDKDLVTVYMNIARKKKSKNVQIIFHPFKPSADEMYLWDRYPGYKRFFNRKDVGVEKVNLLSHTAYFKGIAKL